jgi:hypothetical protein
MDAAAFFVFSPPIRPPLAKWNLLPKVQADLFPDNSKSIQLHPRLQAV